MKDRETEEKIYSRKVIISLIVITILVFTVISISFTAFVKQEQVKHSNEDLEGNVSMTYTESKNGIFIENASPVSDAVGKALNAPGEYFDFTVKTTVVKNQPITYEITAIKDSDCTISDQDIKIYLEKQVNGTYEQLVAPTAFEPIKEKTNVGSPINSMVLKRVKSEKSGFDNYRLRMWVNEKAVIQDVKTYAIKINVYGKIV